MSHRIFYIGEFESRQYDEAMAAAFEKLGHDVRRFKFYDFVRPRTLADKIQNRLLDGPNYWRLSRAAIAEAEAYAPDVVYMRRPNQLGLRALHELKRRTGATLLSFQNDDPFGPDGKRHIFRKFHKTFGLFDVHFTLRELNVEEFRQAGAQEVEVLLPYFVEEIHRLPELTEAEKKSFQAEAIFLGHGEPDNRLEALDALVEAGLSIKLGGSGFEKFAKGRPHERLLPADYYYPDIYPKAIRAAGCALCFFSKANRDVLTYRVFEIPACGGVLVAERNPTIEKFFLDREEALFFSTTAELVDIVQFLKNNPEAREVVARRGRERLLRGHHEVVDRAAQIIRKVESLSPLK